MPSITLNSGAIFYAEKGQSILEAAAHAQILLPYSCKVGRCSTCKCKVISGVTQALQVESGLTDSEKSEGWILSCVRSTQTDLVLEAEDLGGSVLPQPKTLPCRISRVERLTENVIRVQIRLAPTAEFNFIAGQYIDVIGPSGVRRSYSIANADFFDRLLELHIRAVNNGVMSEYWFNHAKTNDLLRLRGPFGTFFLRPSKDIDLIFLATGTGIAPVKSIIESLPGVNLKYQPKSVTVLWGGRVQKDIYMDLNSLPGILNFIPVLSRADEGWVGVRGYVHDALIALKPDLENSSVYACGSESMIRSARSLLVKTGLSPNRFYSDAFVSSGELIPNSIY
jgi:CDP-4-dehydro-6-deoxyglucose reductase